MNCLCCGKKLSKEEHVSGWHKRCIRKFFGTNKLPEINLNNEVLETLALEATSKGLTVPGVQKKLSLHLFSKEDHPRLTIVDYPTGYILKPKVKEFESLPESEHLIMSMAEQVGIATVQHGLIEYQGEYAYITKRADRILDKENYMAKYAMEDFCQIGQRLTRDKYRGSYEKCAKIIRRHSSRSKLDMTEFFLRIIFCYIVGNSDMHLKNFSIIEQTPKSGKYILAPAYDLLPVNCIMPEDIEETALALNGKKMNLRKKDFYKLAESCEITSRVAERLIYQVVKNEKVFHQMCDESYISEEMKERLHELMRKRCEIF